MRLMHILQSSLLGSLLLLSPLAAEEVDAATKCDQAYETCQEKCEQTEDGSEKCYEACDAVYDVCLSEAEK